MLGLSVAFLLPWPFFRSVERTDQRGWNQLSQAFSERGVLVSYDHPRCREPDLYGLYVRGTRTVVVCNRGDRTATLRHEGWHLVQSLCLKGTPWLSAEEVNRRIDNQDRLELQALVQPERYQREAEARTMAQLSNDRYLEALQQACGSGIGRSVESSGDSRHDHAGTL